MLLLDTAAIFEGVYGVEEFIIVRTAAPTTMR
jgi:hypothetical protein